ncbi:MAG: hypothetical protein ACO35E_05530 [Ilumatobacteraceae bacterium]
MASRPDPSSPTAVAQAEFPVVRRGLAPDEVRSFLIAVGAELERSASRLAAVEAELEQARRERLDLSAIDDETLARMVGEETAAVLRAAREGAAQLRSRAEQSAAELLEAAGAEADRVRQSAAEEAARTLADAKSTGREMIDEAARHRERVELAAERHRESARLWAAEVEVEQRRLAEQFVKARAMADEAVARLGPPPVPADVEAVVDEAGDDATAHDATGHDETGDDEAGDEPMVGGDGPAVVLFDGDADADDPGSAEDPGGDTAENVVRLFAVPERRDDVDPAPADDGAGVVDDVGPGVQEVVGSLRDSALGRVPAAATRTAKRVLADEQNAVLETLSAARPVTDLADVLPGPDEHAAMYVAAVIADLEAAAAIGAAGGATPPVPDAARTAVVDLVSALRERVERVVDEGSSDNQVIAKRLRAVYRDVKSSLVEVAVTDAVFHAHAAGQLAGAADGVAFRWVAEAGARPCPDCEDNSLAGPTPAGEPFPAGHVAPPAHPGCRCELVADHG